MINKHIPQWKKGFTLAELMAVVAIIAILAGIVLGSYWKSTEQAIFTEGLNGAQSLAAAVDEYYYDNNAYPSSMKRLAMGLKKAVLTDSYITTTHFKYTIESSSKLRAERLGGNYYIDIPLQTHYIDVAGLAVPPDACVHRSEKGKELCQAMGYTKCNDSTSECTK